MYRSRSTRRTRVLFSSVVVASLALAACGSDDDEAAETTAAAPAETTADTTAESTAGSTAESTADTTAGSTAETTAGTTMETTAESTEETTAESTAGSDAPAASGMATMDEIAAMCPADTAPDKLVMSVWSPNATQLGPAFAEFTEATGVEIEFLENDLTARLTKMAAEKGSPTIDLAIVPVNEVPALLENGIVEETDTEIPNYEQLTDVAKLDGGYGSSILQFGIAYNPEFVTTPPTSWADLFDPAYAGHVAFPTMPNSGGYAALSMLTEIAGGTTDDLEPGIQTVADAKDGIVTFYPFSGAVEPQVQSGEIWMYPDIGGAVLAAADRGNPVEFAVPDEGGPAGLNVVVVPAGSDHADCTKAAVSFFLGETMQTNIAEQIHYGTVSTGFTLPDEIAATVYPQDPDTLVTLDWPTLAANGPDTIDLWNRLVVG